MRECVCVNNECLHAHVSGWGQSHDNCAVTSSLKAKDAERIECWQVSHSMPTHITILCSLRIYMYCTCVCTCNCTTPPPLSTHTHSEQFTGQHSDTGGTISHLIILDLGDVCGFGLWQGKSLHTHTLYTLQD